MTTVEMSGRSPRPWKRSLAYWIPTIAILLLWGPGGLSTLLEAESSLEVFRRLGYPEYFPAILGTAQVLGVVAVLAPMPAMLREWAYAGLAIDASAAILSLVAIRAPALHLAFPLIGLAAVLASHRMWNVRKRVVSTVVS